MRPETAGGGLMLRLDETMTPALAARPRAQAGPLALRLGVTAAPAPAARGGLDLALGDTTEPATGPRPGPVAGDLDPARTADSWPGSAAGHLSLTLEQTIRLALEGSRDAASARLAREDQLLGLEAAEERYRPRVSLEASWSESGRGAGAGEVSVGPSLRVPTGGSFRLSLSKPLAGEREGSTRTALTFSQPLLKGFGTDIDTVPLRRARLSDEIDVRAFRDRVGALVRSVVGAYRGVLRAGRRVAIAREALARARGQLETNRALVQAGRMAPQDLVQTQSEVGDREYALLDAENALDTAHSSLANVLDVDEGTRIKPSEEPQIVPRHPNLEQSLETAFARHTDWLRAEMGVERAEMDLRVAENDLLPNLSLNAAVSHRGGGDTTDWSGRLTLSVPLWDRSPKRALARARNTVRRAVMTRAETRQAIRSRVRRAVHDVAVGLRQIELAREGRALAERKLDIERLKLEQGLSSAYQLGRIEDDVVRAQNREVDALTGYRNALTSLDAELGTTLDRWGVDIERVGR